MRYISGLWWDTEFRSHTTSHKMPSSFQRQPVLVLDPASQTDLASLKKEKKKRVVCPRFKNKQRGSRLSEEKKTVPSLDQRLRHLLVGRWKNATNVWFGRLIQKSFWKGGTVHCCSVRERLTKTEEEAVLCGNVLVTV